MTKLTFLGAISTVGASGIEVATNDKRILLDYGVEVQTSPPRFALPVDKPDAILVSHPHLDHCGGLALFPRPPIYAVNVTKPLAEMLLNDSIKISSQEGVRLPFTEKDVRNTVSNFRHIEYRKKFNIGRTEVSCFDAGHIPGSMMTHLRIDNKSLLYTGDFNTKDTHLIKAADNKLPQTDVLITESTYSDRDHLDRRGQEKELIDIIRETLAVDGVALIGSFAISRAQEILLILHKHGIDYPLFMDGMAKKATTIINGHNNLLREPTLLDEALEKVSYISNENRRKKILKNPGVVITTSGMLNGGPVLGYLKNLYDRPTCSLSLVGYQVEGTPGKTLLETGRLVTGDTNVEVKMFVKRLDFSSHVGRTDLFRFVEKVNPKKVFCIHGDHTEEFAGELRQKGFDAIAPIANNRIFNI